LSKPQDGLLQLLGLQQQQQQQQLQLQPVVNC
jgi:hypothetical protein